MILKALLSVVTAMQSSLQTGTAGKQCEWRELRCADVGNGFLSFKMLYGHWNDYPCANKLEEICEIWKVNMNLFPYPI